MHIEIHGAGFQNKGAELMLRTTVHELGKRLKDFSPAIDPFYGSYESRCELKLQQLFPFRGHIGTPNYSKHLRKQKQFSHPLVGKIIKRIIGKPANAYGCVTLSEMQALVDISGFAYTDQWGLRPTLDFVELTNYYKSQGKPVILLPQAFGPFEHKNSQKAFSQIVDNATLVFARDDKSYIHATLASNNSHKILKAPDITLFHSNISPNLEFDPSMYVCIVPNARILDQGQQSWGDKYKYYLTCAMKAALKHTSQIYIVVHDSSGEDIKIAYDIYKQFSEHDVALIEEKDPLKLKNIIANSQLVVGSRYHSLVAALSNCVPSIAIGWSHKYEMLFKDFEIDKFLVSPDDSLESFIDKVDELLNASINNHFRKEIQQKLQEMTLSNQNMWERVISILSEEY